MNKLNLEEEWRIAMAKWRAAKKAVDATGWPSDVKDTPFDKLVELLKTRDVAAKERYVACAEYVACGRPVGS